MLFYEPLFLFGFFPLVFVAFLLLRGHAGPRAWLLLAASVFFYLWSQPLFVPIVLATCITDIVLGRIIAREGRGKRAALIAGICINLGILAYYKYTDFTVDNLDMLLAWTGLPALRVGSVALPIGVSFIVFEKISYLVDIARKTSKPSPDFQTYLLYVFLFPKLLAGPIMKYHELEAQLLIHGASRTGDLTAGFQRFMLGVVKKTILADTLAAGADMSFNVDAHLLGSADAWWGVLFFTFQIYLDFSAYSDMAIGLARMFGFQLSENFDKPYISGSVTEFWRRWHMSLTSWIRDYLYIPLGGNRVPTWRRYLNLWICFLLSGLWHGAAWHFVAWGAYNGVFLVLERVFLLRALERLPLFAATAVTFMITLLGWTLFRSNSLEQAWLFVRAMMQPGLAGHAVEISRTPMMMTMLAVAALISFLPRVPGYDRIAADVMATEKGQLVLNIMLALLFIIALAMALANPFKPFLYFRF
jgi:alginate O-acetyltransferase complex protein AlgI